MKIWEVLDLDKKKATDIATELNIPLIVAIILQVRGFSDYDEIMEFLSEDIELSDPFLMIDMDKAVERINKAINNFEKICIYGDYDADGVTSTSLLYMYLSECSANVMYYIPDRECEGYGLNTDAIDKLKSLDVQLIITVDNGISAYKEVEYVKSLGMDIVITDHHTVPEELPKAIAVVNPHRKDCDGAYKDFSGVGVVFKLIMALEDEFLDLDELFEKYCDICAIGTIGDIVPLTGENRVIVKYGVKALQYSQKLGVKELMEEAAIYGQPLTAGKISFTIVPRINACGRLSLSGKSVQLLTTNEEEKAKEIAKELGQDNIERKNIEKGILSSAIKYIDDNPNIKHDTVIVVDGENFHAGVIGIVASRLKEIFGKPVIVISKNEDIAKASGRSISGFSLIDAITHCSSLLTKFGGHPMAVGFSIKSSNISKFRNMINEYANTLPPTFDKITIDCKLNPKTLSATLVSQLSTLQPYGASNPTPIIGLYNMTIDNIIPVGGGKHLKIILKRDNSVVTAMRFGVSLEQFPYQIGDEVDIAVNLDTNNYNDKIYLSVVIKEIKYSNVDYNKILLYRNMYDKFITGAKLTKEKLVEMLPARDDFAKVYRYLNSVKIFNFPLEILLNKIDDSSINYAKLLIILEAMKELNLIEYNNKALSVNIKMLIVSGKTDLNSANIIKILNSKIDKYNMGEE